MAELQLTKQAAAQRQIDAAIRILFSGEDVVAVHTVVAAAYNVITDLDNKSGKKALAFYADILSDLQNAYPGIPLPKEAAEFRVWFQRNNRSGANFLKHADKDSTKALDPSKLSTDLLLLEACGIYCDLGLKPTREMKAFIRWHLAVYPSHDEDRIITKSGDVSKFNRSEQLEFGLFLLDAIS